MIAAWMVYATAVGALTAAAATALEVTLRGRGPTRWIWASAMAASVAIPSVGFLSGSRPDVETVTDLRGIGGAAMVVPSDVPAAPPEIGPQVSPDPSPSPLAVRVPGLPVSWDQLPVLSDGWGSRAGSVWGLLSGLGGLWIVWATLALRLRRRAWRRSSVNGREVLVSEDTGPAVVGLWNAEIVLPRWSLALGAADRELMLRHEEEHRRARDLVLVTGAVVLFVVLPWNLALWWQLRRLRLAVEIDCDRRVLSGRTDVGRYGSLLVDLGGRGRRRTLGAALAFARPMPFLERRIRVMTGTSSLRPVRTTLFAAVAGLLLLGACRMESPPVPATPSDEPTSTAERTTESLTEDELSASIDVPSDEQSTPVPERVPPIVPPMPSPAPGPEPMPPEVPSPRAEPIPRPEVRPGTPEPVQEAGSETSEPAPDPAPKPVDEALVIQVPEAVEVQEAVELERAVTQLREAVRQRQLTLQAMADLDANTLTVQKLQILTEQAQQVLSLAESLELPVDSALSDAVEQIRRSQRLHERRRLELLASELARRRDRVVDSLEVQSLRQRALSDSVSAVADSTRAQLLRSGRPDSVEAAFIRRRALFDQARALFDRAGAVAEIGAGAARQGEGIDRLRTILIFGREQITGRLLAPDGVTPLERVSVWAPGFEAGVDSRATDSDEAGRFLLMGVKSGTRRLVFEHPDVGRWEMEVEVRADGTTDLGDVIAPGG
jgi:hypothetical protein